MTPDGFHARPANGFVIIAWSGIDSGDFLKAYSLAFFFYTESQLTMLSSCSLKGSCTLPGSPNVSITHCCSVWPLWTHLPVLGRHVNVCLLSLVFGTCSFLKTSFIVSQRGVWLSPIQCCAWLITVTRQQQIPKLTEWIQLSICSESRSLMAQGLWTRLGDLPLACSEGAFVFGVRKGVLRNKTLQFIKSNFMFHKRNGRHVQKK